MRHEFTANLTRESWEIVEAVFEKMKIKVTRVALKIETRLRVCCSARRQWMEAPSLRSKGAVPEIIRRRPQQQTLFDVKGRHGRGVFGTRRRI